MCANVHASKHCDNEGYDLISMNMVSFVPMKQVDKVIPKVKRALILDYSGSYAEAIILAVPKIDTSRTSQRPMRPNEIRVSCMRLGMEISLDGGFKTSVNEQPL